MAGNVWVAAEHWRGSVSDATHELLALGRDLADSLGVRLEAVLLGHGVRGLAAGMGTADSVLYVDHPALADATGQQASRALVALAATLPGIPGVLPVDLVLSGCQANDALDGFVAPLVALALDLPYLGLVSRITVDPDARKALVAKEYAGGVMGRFEVVLPAFLGVQGCERPPRYVPISKVRAAMASGAIEAVAAASGTATSPLDVTAMAKPEVAGHAAMIEGSVRDVAEKVADILAARGLL